MKKLICMCSVLGTMCSIIWAVPTLAQSVKEYKIGEMIPLKDGTELKIYTGSPYMDVFTKSLSMKNIKGTPEALTLEFSGEIVSLSFALGSNGTDSDIYLAIDNNKLHPYRFLLPDRDRYGVDQGYTVHDKTEFKKGKDGRYEFFMFSAQGSSAGKLKSKAVISIIFDVPSELSKVSKKLFLLIKTGGEESKVLVNIN